MSSNDSTNVLIVDDDPEIRDSLAGHLEKSGFSATVAPNAADARSVLSTNEIDLVVLDIMMPGEDGLSLCRNLRETADTPVILLTALSDETDRIVGLEIGADDYLTKPFNPRELVARIRAVLRRTSEKPASIADAAQQFGNWTLDEAQSELTNTQGLIITLSSGELKLLRVFLDHPDQVLSRDDLMQSLQGRETYAFERSIDNTISRLRRKVEVDPANPRLIKTVRGGGYRLIQREP